MGDLDERPQKETKDIDIKQFFSKVRDFFDGAQVHKIKEAVFSTAGIRFMAAFIIGALLAGSGLYYYNYRKTSYAVKYKGEFLGYVKDREAVLEALKDARAEMLKYDSAIAVSDDISFQRVLVNSDKVIGVDEIEETIKSDLYEAYTSYAISVNGNEMFYVASQKEADKVVEGIKKYYTDQEAKNGAKVLSILIRDDIKATPKIVDTSKVVDTETAIKTLTGEKGVTKKYTVKSGDTIWRIAKANSMKLSNIMAANPGMDVRAYILDRQ
jgi:LysM repeat protein